MDKHDTRQISEEVYREAEARRRWEVEQSAHQARIRRRMLAQHTGDYVLLVAEWRRLTPSDIRSTADIWQFLMHFLLVVPA